LISDCISRRHARIERRLDGFHIIDLESTNGTYLNDVMEPVRDARLGRGDQLKIGDFIFKFLSGNDVEAQYHEIIFSMTVTDGLTNVSNKRQLDNVLTRELARVQRQPGEELSILMFDIDHFKQVNDTHGHLAGDSVLRILASLLRKRLRPTDDLGRY